MTGPLAEYERRLAARRARLVELGRPHLLVSHFRLLAAGGGGGRPRRSAVAPLRPRRVVAGVGPAAGPRLRRARRIPRTPAEPHGAGAAGGADLHARHRAAAGSLDWHGARWRAVS